jgi:RNA polymerase sigma-70 factor (ECF subfamily)
VGTVRSRLNQARKKLTDALLDSADRVHPDTTRWTGAQRRLAQDVMRSTTGSDLVGIMAHQWSPELVVTWPTGRRTGLDHLSVAYDSDLSDGVRHELVNVVAGRRVVIWESALHNPPDDPSHCPPGVVWVHFLDQDQVNRVRLYHPPRRRNESGERSNFPVDRRIVGV